ncbi:uncharacterized protein LOC117394136 isoform X3 [Periophthalmus magnuspinnatus]|nr:uncharacterized protein LOC117394136 isoform X3 [Periophthalmus magnuspinnatus]
MLLMSSESAQSKKRKKREWIIPPSKLKENTDYTDKEYIAKIRSDKDKDSKVEYFLTGAGADRPPFNLFVVDHETGFVRITAKLDREKFPSYNLTGMAKFVNGSIAEDDIPLTVTVLDENDNHPYFELHTGNISEASEKGTLVMKVQGKDDDEPGTINSELHYSIISQKPEGELMFTIDEKTGELRVKEPTLDRETYEFYKLVIQVRDMGGGPDGLTGTGTVEIKILDINDNVPTLEKSGYTGSVDENVQDVEVMRIKAKDLDLEHTDNWLAVFHIVKGNEDKLFSIETDKETNEGILKLIKPVDFEEVQNLDLDLLIENVAPFVVGSAVLMDVDVKVGEGGGAGVGAGLGADLGLDMGVGMDLGLDMGLHAGVDAGLDADLGADLEADLDADLDAELDPDLGVDLGLDVGPHPELGVVLHPGGKPGPGGGPAAGPAGGAAGPGLGAGVGVGLHPEGHLGPLGPGKKPRPKKKRPKKKPSYPIHISVNNMPEGPEFVPETKDVPVSEDPDKSIDDVITTYAAIDPDTGEIAEDVNYAKAFDPDNWITIDEDTAEIRLNKVPDRESPFVINGTYIAKILAITKDMPSKTATGTIAIKVTDSNDHCPKLDTVSESICADAKTVYVSATDGDVDPNGPPFTFQIVTENTRGLWEVEILSDTTAAIHSQETLWRGAYGIEVAVYDAKGKACPTPEVFTVDVCDCEGTDYADCSVKAATSDNRSMEFAGPAISLMIVAVCMLLFVPCLLVFCQFGGPLSADRFSELPFDAKEYLIAYHTEGKGEDKEMPLFSSPVMMGTQAKVEGGTAFLGGMTNETKEVITTEYEESFLANGGSKVMLEGDNNYNTYRERYFQGLRGRTVYDQQTALFENIALPDVFLEEYYTQKSAQTVAGKDALLVYDDESQASPAGSVGCCSLLESDNDLQFLDDLGPKFKILADICLPTPFPHPTSTYKITGPVKTEITKTNVEPVVIPKVEKITDKHIDVKTEKVMSSTNVSKSSVSNVSSASPPLQPPMTLLRSQLTNITSNINQISNISSLSNASHLATLPRPPTIVVQQPQLFYATSPIPMQMPVQYIMQPPVQNTVLVAEGGTDPKLPGYIVVGGPQITGQTGRVTQSTTHIIKSPGVSGGFTSGSLTSASPLSPSAFFPRSPNSATTSPTSSTILLPGSPGSPGMVGMEGWKIVGPNPEGHYMLVKDKSTLSETGSCSLGSPEGTSPKGVVLKKEAAPPQGVLGHAAHSGVIGVMSEATVNKPLGGALVVQPQHVGLSSVRVLGVGVEVTQNTGIKISQSSAPLVQTQAAKPKESKQDRGEQSFSKTLIKKGKMVPKKLHINKTQTEVVKDDNILNTVPKPHVHLMSPAPPLETIKEITADPLIVQSIQIHGPQMLLPTTENSEFSEEQEGSPNIVDVVEPAIATETLNSSTTLTTFGLPLSNNVTGLEDTISTSQDVDNSIESATDIGPPNDDSAEPKNDQKYEDLGEDISNHAISELIEDMAKEVEEQTTSLNQNIEISTQEDMKEEQMHQDEDKEAIGEVQENDAEVVFEESQMNKPNLDITATLEEDTSSLGKNTDISTNQEEEGAVGTVSPTDKEENKLLQDEDKEKIHEIQEKDPEVVEESQMDNPNLEDANINDQEVEEPAEIEVEEQIPSKPEEMEGYLISLHTENPCQESNANQEFETEVEQNTKIVADKEGSLGKELKESIESLPVEDLAVKTVHKQHEPSTNKMYTKEIHDNQDLDASENLAEGTEIEKCPIVDEYEQPESIETSVSRKSTLEKLIPETMVEENEADLEFDQEHNKLSEDNKKEEPTVKGQDCNYDVNTDPITDAEQEDMDIQQPEQAMEDMVPCEEQTSQQKDQYITTDEEQETSTHEDLDHTNVEVDNHDDQITSARSMPVKELDNEKEEEISAEILPDDSSAEATDEQQESEQDQDLTESQIEQPTRDTIEESQQLDLEIKEENNSDLGNDLTKIIPIQVYNQIK